jgi:beta-aspartyl-peptidase (threonine type)
MKKSSGNGGVYVGIGLILLLLLSAGAVIAFFIVNRQRIAMAMERERAQVARKQAFIRSEQLAILAAGQSASNADSSNGRGKSIRAAVESVLSAQEDAWNKGDLDAFMKHYWKSEKLTFNSGGKTTRGWTETLDRYRQRYPTREKMGRLDLSGLEITPLGESAALVLGQWKLERENDPVSGNFTLALRKFDEHWLIIHDHTSRSMD